MKTKGAVLISGASSGIGQTCTTFLAQQGYQVFAGIRTDSDSTYLRTLSPLIVPVFLELTDPVSIERCMAQITDQLDGKALTGLINNAGIVVGGPLECLPLEALQEQFNVNITGQLALTQAVLPLLRESRKQQAPARIINIGSTSGTMALPFLGPYAASKHALEAISDALRMELKPWGIMVSLVQAGSIQTPIWEKSVQNMERRFQSLPKSALAQYAHQLSQVRLAALQSGIQGLEPIHVARSVHHGLSAVKPKARYQVGRAFAFRRMIASLPEPFRDWLIMRKMGLL